MADFRRWLYAFAVVALLVGLTIPASAQNTIQCQTNTSVPPVVRSQGYAELMGDLVLSCTGGSPTTAGANVPPANVTVFLTTNITSKLVGSGSLFSEALLIVDDPNAPGPNSNRPILNCGAPNAPDLVTNPGVCQVVALASGPQNTYNGSAGHPNVFQGRPNPNSGLSNSIVFLGVPLDPPGTGTTRSFRVTNIRADAEFIGVSGNFTTNSITMNIAVNGNTSLSINNPAQIVAFVQNGLGVAVLNPRLDFIQCQTENGLLDSGAVAFSFLELPFGGALGGGANGGSPFGPDFSNSPIVHFSEGFGTAWKPRNLSEVVANGLTAGGVLAYNGGLSCGNSATCGDDNQNVPGTINYNTETGFNYNANDTTTNPNPPNGIGSGSATGAINTPQPFSDALGTGIETAGIASQGTRLALAFQNIPGGSNVWVPPVIYLYRQGTIQLGGPTASNPVATPTNGTSTGVMVLVTTAADGSGGVPVAPVNNNLVEVSVTGGTGLAVYEVLFADPSSVENADVPVVISYTSNLSANPPGGDPVTGVIAQVTGSYAPFYSSAAARLPSATLPVPRFTTLPATPLNLYEISKCSCNLLFPFVTVQAGFDTGIAIANTSQDPGPTVGFFATPQQGTITFYYFGIGDPTGGAAPQPQTSALVPQGQVLTYDLFSGGGAIGASANGLDNRASSFQGYIIAQAQFQYCHGFAFISNLGDPVGGISEGYLGIVLDKAGLPRTLQAGENDAH